MSEESKPRDLGAVWRNQPEEERKVNLQRLVNRRTQDLYATTRGEILMSIGAACFFIAVSWQRFEPAPDRLQQLGFAAMIAWVLISLIWFRDWIWRKYAPRGDALAATGVEHYRKELERRRDHLRNAWLWHGPLILACLTLVATVLGKAFPGLQRLLTVLLLVIALAVWTGFDIWRRRRQAQELQREIDQIGAP